MFGYVYGADTVLCRVRFRLRCEGECEYKPQVEICWTDAKMKVRSPEHGKVLVIRLSDQ